jgi:hypothetical protein
MTFPDARDRQIISDAAAAVAMYQQLEEWLGNFSAGRTAGMKPISDGDKFDLLTVGRASRALLASANRPVAAAIYGVSQVGKSLLIGRILAPATPGAITIGRDPTHVGHGLKYVSFHDDLNPQNQGFEATCMVTVFTTKDRMPASGTSSALPVMVRAMNRAQWLSVLGRGFLMECVTPTQPWTEAEIENKLQELVKTHGGKVAPGWRSDLMEAYHYLRGKNKTLFAASEPQFFGLLSNYGMDDAGYAKLAALLFWDNWPQLTTLFQTVEKFLDDLESYRVQSGTPQPYSYIHVDWRAVRFLLDSQQHPSYSTANFGTVRYDDFRVCRIDGRVELSMAASGESIPLDILQAAMLEMVVPVIPDNLNEPSRKLFSTADVGDMPGCLPGKTSDGGKRRRDEPLDKLELQQIVKRGKVAYLFESYSHEKRLQTLLVLVRGGDIRDGGTLKDHINQWGQSRYEKRWHEQIALSPDQRSALLIGLTGFDETFRNISAPLSPAQVDARFKALRVAINPIMENFGGTGKPFSDTYLLRYPGSWDATVAEQIKAGKHKWDDAYDAVLKSPCVEQHMADAATKVDRAKQDQDGGLSLVAEHLLEASNPLAKQDELMAQIKANRDSLRLLAQSWHVPGDAAAQRAMRLALAGKVLKWLASPHHRHRTAALIDALSLRDGDTTTLADLADHHIATTPATLKPLILRELSELLHRWSTVAAPQRWTDHCDSRRRSLAPADFIETYDPSLFSFDDFCHLTAYLRDYLLSTELMECLCTCLMPIINLRLATNAAAMQRRSRRLFTRMVIEDFLLNPGPNGKPPLSSPISAAIGPAPPMIPPPKAAAPTAAAPTAAVPTAAVPTAAVSTSGSEFVERWKTRLPAVLSFGENLAEPPAGNSELAKLLEHPEWRT